MIFELRGILTPSKTPAKCRFLADSPGFFHQGRGSRAGTLRQPLRAAFFGATASKSNQRPCGESFGQARRIGINHRLAHLRGASPMPSRGLRATASSGRRFRAGRGLFRLQPAVVPRCDRTPTRSCSTLSAPAKSRDRSARPSARREPPSRSRSLLAIDAPVLAVARPGGKGRCWTSLKFPKAFCEGCPCRPTPTVSIPWCGADRDRRRGSLGCSWASTATLVHRTAPRSWCR